MTPLAEAPWVSDPFGLVSLEEIVALMTGSDDFSGDGFPTDQIILGPLQNAVYALARIEHGLPSARDLLQIAFYLKQAAESLEGWGFAASVGSFRDLAELLEDHAVKGREPLHSVETLPTFAIMARQTVQHELKAQIFLPVDQAAARYFNEPRRDWEAVIERFPDTVSDIEEAGRCFALRRYPAAVFHCMQVMEHGLLALGEFMQLNDPKSGFTAVANALQRIKDKKYPDLSDFEKEHFAFFEQMHGSVQAAKDAWRNKINHAQGAARLMTADFSEAVALEIYVATRGFMRRLATEMPEQKHRRRWR